ncbi:MAG: sulfite exporter TauE/SafE family protein [Armatimonadota bacterium]
MDFNLEPWQWVFGIAAAVLTGISKTGMPGVGILVVPLLASAFGGRASVGIMLPMLIFADLFAVFWYKRHARWDKLIILFPWVVAGIILGTQALWILGKTQINIDIMAKIIGALVLIMLTLHLLRDKLDERLTPKSKIGKYASGIAAGFTTTISNAAGPVMAIYLAAQNITKEQFMGTTAWFFFLVNAAKLPIFIWLSIDNPEKPMITLQTLQFNISVFPAILVGAFVGKWILRKISQKLFDNLILILAAVAAIKLLVS